MPLAYHQGANLRSVHFGPLPSEVAVVSAHHLRMVLWWAGAVVGLSAEWLAYSSRDLPTAVADLTVGWALIACGLMAWSRRPQSGVGALLAASGFAWFLGTFADSTVGVLSVLGLATLTLHRGPLFHAILGYPTGKFRGWFGRMVIALGYVYASIAAIGSSPVATLTTTSVVGVATIGV
jgi:hypothetical protein